MPQAKMKLLALALLATASTARAQSAPDQAAQQFRDYCLGNSTDHGERLLDDVELPKTPGSQAIALVAKMQSDGSWPDINYAGTDRSAWEPYAHLTRILSLTLYARRNPNTKDAATCMAAVHSALAFWGKRDFTCPNWWYNVIGVPKILGTIDILLGPDLTPDEFKYFSATVMPRSKLGTMTGQNRVWIAGNNVMLAVLKRDDALLKKSSAVIAAEIHIASPASEGIQSDQSFHQHGPQQQFGNYGLAFAVDMTRWAVVLRNTPAAIPDAQIAILRTYLLNGEARTIFGGAMDISSCGRQIEPHTPAFKAATLDAVLATMKKVDPANASAYADSTSSTGPVYFYRSDYLVNRTSDLMVSLKMRSQRVIGGETVNSENLSGRHLADGATFFYKSAAEYTDIFPTWNWNYIPGTTSLDQTQPLSWTMKKKSTAEPAASPTDIPKAERSSLDDLSRGTIFTGGLTAGDYAAAAMDFSTLESPDLTAHKAWVFAGDLTICLGADISSTTNAPVVTTLNQSLLHGPVHSSNENKEIPPGEQTLQNIDWITHDNFRYIFPTPTTVTLRTGPVTGNWKTVFNTHATPKPDVTQKMFTLFIPHGTKPAAASYAYIVAPITEPYLKRVEILSNTKNLQAVRIDKKFIAVIFWTAGKFRDPDFPLAADYPCIVGMDITDPKTPKLFVCDPSQKLPAITLTFNGTTHRTPMPGGTSAGQTVTVK